MRWATMAASLLALLVFAGCADCGGQRGSHDFGGGPPYEDHTTTTIVEKLGGTTVDALDLLLVIDNSPAMADKQQILSRAVPQLLRQLTNPPCVDVSGQPAAEQPSGALGDCPTPGTRRAFEPLVDIHIGVVTSSLGGHGSDSCLGSSPEQASESDAAHLIDRESTEVGAASVPTWEGWGFLAWDPTGAIHSPPGEDDIDGLTEDLRLLVSGAGEVGCGFEAPLEAWYRFLVDPDPYESIALESYSAVLHGTDTTLLGQRQRFLRPDSLVVVLMLSDENDCSIRDGGQFYFAAQDVVPGGGTTPYHLPKPRAACASDPQSPCCRSCGQGPGDGCDTSADDCSGALAELDDPMELRCWDQKRRFGIDFLYPLERYVDALSLQDVVDRHGNLTQNPLFRDLDPNDQRSAVRDQSLVFVAGIVGVPWQDLSRKDAQGNPDLLAGLDAEGEPVGGFQSFEELHLQHTWDLILGDPACYTNDPASCLPGDAHMIEDWALRPGLVGPGASDPIHGHERTIAQNDLQYACIFPLIAPRDCTDVAGCPCHDPANDDPLCESPPGSDTFGTTQYAAAAYPGIRQLELLREVGAQGVVGSICPAQVNDPGSRDFGYLPAIDTLLTTLKQQALGAECQARSLTPQAGGQVPCMVFEARNVAGGDCGAACSAPARAPLAQDHPAVDVVRHDPQAEVAGWNCFCELTQLGGEALAACQQDPADPPVVDGDFVHGWCYIDASAEPPLGNPDLVAQCPEDEKRILRFVGDGHAAPEATLFITCTGE